MDFGKILWKDLHWVKDDVKKCFRFSLVGKYSACSSLTCCISNDSSLVCFLQCLFVYIVLVC